MAEENPPVSSGITLGGNLRPNLGNRVQLAGLTPGSASASGYLPAMSQNLTLKVTRRLPVAGDVVVGVGHKVESDTIVATTRISGKPQIFNLAEYFEVTPKEAVKFLQKDVQETFKEDDLIAARKGLVGRRQFRAPFDGTISALDETGGYISLTPRAQPFGLEAYVRGMVVEVIQHYGVSVQLQAAYARGAFGFGRERHGVLRVVSVNPAEPLDPASIDARATNFILLGGSYVTAESLRRAVELKARGIIAGSIHEEELTRFLEYRRRNSFYRVGSYNWRFPAEPSSLDSPFTLVITEGFGIRPMANRLFEMLAGHDGEELSLNGQTQLRRGLQRPEIIIPLVTTGGGNRPPASRFEGPLVPRVGSVVRVINPSYLGAVGQVVNLPASRRGIHPGQLERLAKVDVQGTTLVLPFADIEVLEQDAALPRTV